MELGEKLLCARQEAGLSQRQLCGERITRNMLSQIEHGTARPSMDTLKYLASRLGKPVSYFLDEEVVTSPNRQVILDARQALEAGDPAQARTLLAQYQPGDTVFLWEYRWLSAKTALAEAEKALAEGRPRYAQQLLEDGPVCGIPELQRQRLLLLGRTGQDPAALCRELPSLDEELILRSRGAMADRDWDRAGKLLDAAEDRLSPRWNLLRGQVYLSLGAYPDAARCLHLAEETYPKETAPLLEHCFRELGDYKQAYEYACKQR